MQIDKLLLRATQKEINVVRSEMVRLGVVLDKSPNISLKFLISCWCNLSENVKGKYPFAIYRYLHDLTLRDALYRIELDLPSDSEFKTQLVMAMEEIDQLFMQRTTQTSAPIRENHSEMRWWWYRKPQMFLLDESLQFYPRVILSPETYDQIRKQEYMDKFSELKLEKLISEWIDFVMAVKNGYKLSIDNYGLSLYRRESIIELESFLQWNELEQVTKILTTADKVYAQTTMKVSEEIFWSLRGESSKWWWDRIPKLAKARFFEKLRYFIKDETVILPKGF